MARLAPPDDYEDDANRIEDNYVGDRYTEDEIAEQLDSEGFPDAAIDDITSWLVTTEDVTGEIEIDVGADTGEIAQEINSMAEINSSRAEGMAEEIEQDVRRSTAQSIGQVSPSDMGVSDRQTPVAKVEDQAGNTVAVAGGYAEDRQAIAEETGAQEFDSINELQDSYSVSGGQVRLGDDPVADL